MTYVDLEIVKAKLPLHNMENGQPVLRVPAGTPGTIVHIHSTSKGDQVGYEVEFRIGDDWPGQGETYVLTCNPEDLEPV